MEVILKSFALTHPAFSGAGAVTVSAELVWPRPAISSRVGLLPLELRRGKAALARMGLYERLLLKERVYGSFGLVVGITRPGTGPLLSPALAEIFSTALSGIGSGLASGLANTAIRPLMREPLNQMGDRIEGDEPLLIANDGIDLHSDERVDGEKKFVLKTTRTLKVSAEPKSGPRTKQVPKKRKMTTLRRGTAIAEATFELRDA